MRTSAFALLAAALVAVPAVHAQAKPEFGGSLGVALPMGDLGDVANTGWRAGALVQLKPASLPVALRAEANYSGFGGKSQRIGTITVDGGSTNVLDITGNAIYDFTNDAKATTSFYAIGGAGVYNVSDGGGTNFGINAGAGVNFNLAGFKAFGEARFHNVFGDGGSLRFIPLTFGIRF